MIITIEGTDSSGKETQVKLLTERLTKNGIPNKIFSYPDYTSPTGKIVGGPYLGKQEITDCWFSEGSLSVEPEVASLYYAADRRYNAKEIQETINKGYVAILDRYVYSNMAHQGSKIDSEQGRIDWFNWVDSLEFGLLGLPKADLCIFLHMPYEYALELKKNRTSLDQHEVSQEHLVKSERAYLEMQKIYGFKYVNCIDQERIKTINEINDEIFDMVTNFLEKEGTVEHERNRKRTKNL